MHEGIGVRFAEVVPFVRIDVYASREEEGSLETTIVMESPVKRL
jgi:hypothetical protein